MLLDKKGKSYNVDETFDYFTIKAMAIQSLEKIVRQELNRRIVSIDLHKTDMQGVGDIVIANTSNNLFEDQHDTKLSALLLKLKIRNITEYTEIMQ